jgi:ElaB/YqjD/DUF883 family membrane-anchored ribosome-binding protein
MFQLNTKAFVMPVGKRVSSAMDGKLRAVHVAWVSAIPAEMTRSAREKVLELKHLYNQELLLSHYRRTHEYVIKFISVFNDRGLKLANRNHQELIMEKLDKIANSAHEAYDKVASAGVHAAEVMGEKGEQLKNAEQRLVKDCRGYISKNPMTSVGIAAAAGFILGRLLNPR